MTSWRIGLGHDPFTFVEFFAGGGMARAGLGDTWRCLFANDVDQKKVATYEANWGSGHIRQADVASLTLADLPGTVVDLAWASFPCQDLSLAGGYWGLGGERDNARTRSGTFWPFWKLMRGLVEAGRAPRTIVLENVYGCLTSHGGKEFAAIAAALADADYRFGAAVINASHFVPQSRPRVFFVAVRAGETILNSLVAEAPQATSRRPAALVEACAGMTSKAKANWLWWRIAAPAARRSVFSDLVETVPSGVGWHTAAETKYLLDLMTPLNRRKVAEAVMSGRRAVGTIFTGRRARTRTEESDRGPRFASTTWPAACARRPAALRVRQFSWSKARRFAHACCRPEKRPGSWG